MNVQIIRGDALHLPIADKTVDLIVSSPPYWSLRSYQDGGARYDGQIGSEPTPAEFVDALIAATREMIRVLKPTGSIWINLGDKYNAYNGNRGDGTIQKNGIRQSREAGAGLDVRGVRPKSLLGLPWRYAIACIDQLGLILRAEVIWSKPNGLPESVTDRVRRSHETWFHFTVQPRYFAAVDEIREPQAGVTGGQDRRSFVSGNGVTHRSGNKDYDLFNPLGKLPGSVWSIPSQPLTVPPELGVDHFAAFPMEWPRRLVAGWSPSGVCTACDHPRRPVVDKRLVGVWHDKPPQNTHYAGRVQQHMNHRKADGEPMMQTFGSTEAVITGYSCGCDTAWPVDAIQPSTRPAMILDPFGGTGTTALVAHVMGRHGISLDMSADYCRLAAWRTTNPDQLAAAAQVEKPPRQVDGQANLLDLIDGGAA